MTTTDSGTDGAAVVLGGALGLAFLLFDFLPDEEEATAGSFAPGQTVLAWSDAVTPATPEPGTGSMH